MEIKVGDEYIAEQVSTCCVREKERIVRCKDCKRVTIDQGDHDYREPLWCGLHRMDVCLNGYCAWGERREA